MNRIFLLTLIVVTSFFLGFEVKTNMTVNSTANMKRVSGIGGIFFKCQNPKLMRAWYHDHLGLNTNDYGAVFEWFQGADSTKKGFTQWSPFGEKTTYFLPSTKDYMINYRVQNLNELIIQLKNEGVTIVDTVAKADYGSFIHIMDIEGNKIELWEPNDIEYEKLGKSMGAETTK